MASSRVRAASARGKASTLRRDVAATLGSPVTRSIALWVAASILLIELVILVPSLVDRRAEWIRDIAERTRYTADAMISVGGARPVDTLAGIPGVEGVALYAGDGRPSATRGQVPTDIDPAALQREGPRLIDDRVLMTIPVAGDGAALTAVIAVAAGGLQEELLAFGGRVLGLVLIIALFVTAVTMAIVGTRVLRPLARITLALREARRTGHRETVDPRQPGEFGELVAHYNATINEQKAAERRGERLYYQAMHDPLTGLPNRALLSDRLQQALERARRYDERAAVLLLDLDRFKLFNDTHGHRAGDELLRCVAKRIRDVLRDSDTVARLGGDEFAVIEPRVSGVGHCKELCERLRQAIKQPIRIGETSTIPAASIGVTCLPEDGGDSDALLVNADLAMYEAKNEGGDRVRFFHSGMRDDVVRRVTLEQALEEALESEQFVLHYQPIIDLQSNRCVSFEALVRWHHPDQGLVPPNHFLPVVEQAGMIEPLGAWVLRRAIRDFPRLQAMEPGCQRVAVNVAAGQLSSRPADLLVREVLDATGLGADVLTLEITESEVLDSPESTIEGLERAASLGAMIAIDDFGTGYSSLAQVQDLPGHVLKIDRRFVTPLAESRKARDLFGAVVSMGRSLDMRVVAEGIETADQLEIVRASGCNLGQGYHLGRPAPLGD
jgi:diguanylate cyclase (GGDEF)-like protein